MDLMQIPLMHIRRQEHIYRLALADERCTVRGVLDNPALIQFKRRFIHRLFLLVEEIQMLHAALGQGNR